MSRLIPLTLLVLALLTSLPALADDLTIASWNIKRLGHGEQKSYPKLAEVAARFDLLAVQEVMNDEGLDHLEQALEAHTGQAWGVIETGLIGRSSYREKYALLWRESTVEYLGGAVVYVDPGDRYIREPFAAQFRPRTGGEPFVVATVHILYGDSEADRTPEIEQLRQYWLWLQQTFPGNELILLGDFNLGADHPAWEPLRAVAEPLITDPTTLSATDGRYASPYDNIWVSKRTRLPIREAGVVRFPQIIGWDHEKARRHLSDHVPVYLTLGTTGRHPAPSSAVTPGLSNDYRCGQKSTCGAMASCEEARFYLEQCGLSRLDRDGDGTPCESLCR